MQLRYMGRRRFKNRVNDNMVAHILLNGILKSRKIGKDLYIQNIDVGCFIEDLIWILGIPNPDAYDTWNLLARWIDQVDVSGLEPIKKLQRWVLEAVDWLTINTNFSEVHPF